MKPFTVFFHFPGEPSHHRKTVIYADNHDEASDAVVKFYGKVEVIIDGVEWE